jgi:hypothetical protein
VCMCAHASVFVCVCASMHVHMLERSILKGNDEIGI